MRRALAFLLACTLTASSTLAQPTPSPEQEAADGIRQVKEGDFENAVVTLDSAVRRLEGQPERERLLVQALLQLGVALVVLDQGEPARTRFRRALTIDPRLRLKPDAFSPKVIVVFEQARREIQPQVRDDGKGGPGKALVIVGAGAAAAAVAVALAGGDDGGPPVVNASATNARFSQPSVECPDGSNDVPLLVVVLVDVTAVDQTFVIGQAEIEMRIVSSPDVPGEVGFISNRPATPTPDRVTAGTVATVRVDTSLLCGNGPGGPGRFNDWVGRVTLRSPSGQALTATTQLPAFRVHLP
jgi:hypothetical protein